jgi:Na+/H+ antiporter
MSPIAIVFGLLVTVVALTWVARRLRVAYPIFLVIGGLALGFIPGLPQIQLRPDVVFYLFLPPLLYYEALTSSVRDFRAEARSIAFLAVGLVVVTIGAVAFVAHMLIPGMSWGVAIVLGAIVGPTDEIAAIAVAHRLHVPRRLITLIEAESLFNDATSLVIYNVALVAVVTGAFSLVFGAWDLFFDAFAGAAVGLAIGYLIFIVRRRLIDPPLENTISILSGYAAYFAADSLHLSGVLAVIAAALYLGRKGSSIVSPQTRLQNREMQEIVLFIINGMLFILVGLQLHPILSGLAGVASPLALIGYAVAVILTVILVRIVWVFPVEYALHILSPRGLKYGVVRSWQESMIVAWTGMRGGVSLAAALAVPLTIASGASFPNRSLILYLTYGVILATLVLQGLTLPALIRGLGITDDGSGKREELLARIKSTRAALTRLESLAKEPWADRVIVDDYRSHLKNAYARYKSRAEDHPAPEREARAAAAKRIRGELSAAQRTEIVRLRDEDAINDDVMRTIQHELDLEDVRYGV